MEQKRYRRKVVQETV
jgi:hypothetical protein